MMIMQCETSEGKSLLLNSSEVCSQVNLFVFQSELASNLVTVGNNGVVGQVQDVGDFLGLFSFIDQVRHLNLRWAEGQILDDNSLVNEETMSFKFDSKIFKQVICS